MSTSGSDNFVVTRDQIVGDALTNLRVLPPNETPDGDMLVHGARILNDLVKSIDMEGDYLWRMTRNTITTIASTASYALSATIIDIDGPMSFLQSGGTSRSQVERITRKDYMRIPNRTQTGRNPIQFYVEKDLASDGRVQQTVYFWPVPSTSSDSVEYAAFTRGEDFDTGSNNPDFPQDWIPCLKYGLTMMLAPGYGKTGEVAMWRDLYETEKAKLVNDDNEKSDLWIAPFANFGSGAY